MNKTKQFMVMLKRGKRSFGRKIEIKIRVKKLN